MQQSEKTNSLNSYNSGYSNESALRLRLETSQIISQIKEYLLGIVQEVERDADSGQIQIVKVPTGSRKMSDEGIQTILMFVNMIINPSTVQGNFTSENMLTYYLTSKHQVLLDTIMYNRKKWNIQPDQIRIITQSIMGLVEPYMTRLLFNLEREGYANTIKSIESTVNNQRSMFGFSGGE